MEPCNCGELTCPTCGFGPVISSYSRAEALEDGQLVDAGPMAREAGFTIPVALTRTVWDRFVAVPEGVAGQDEGGRLWDVLSMLRFAIRAGGQRDALLFKLFVRNDNSRPRLTTLKAICGPGDGGEPCVTVLMPDED